MDKYWSDMTEIIGPALLDTLYMVIISSIFSVLFGLIIGICIYITDKGAIMENRIVNKVLNIIVDVGRSIPFIILIIVVLPVSKFIVGTTIGREAVIAPLTIAAVPFVGRVIDNALKELDKGVIEAAISFGASNRQIIFNVLIPESAAAIINSITLTVISIIGYSAMAGTIGGGGLGDIAYRYGFIRRNNEVLIMTLILIIILVQIVQFTGSFLSNKFNKK